MRKYKIVLLLIIALGFLVRLVGSRYGYPFALGHFDEIFSVRQAMSFGATKSLRPIMLMYPSLHSYVLFAVYAGYYLIGRLGGWFSAPADFAFLYLTKPFNLYFIARLLSVVFGGLTVLMTYLIAKQVYNRRVGLWAAGLLAMSATHITYSHWAKSDIFMTFLVALSLLFTSLILIDKRLKNYVLAGVFAGLATAAKYHAAWIIVSLLTAHWLVWDKKDLPRRQKATDFSPWMNGFLGRGSDLRRSVGTPKEKKPRPLGRGVSLRHIFSKRLFSYFSMLLICFFVASPYCMLNLRFLSREVAFDLGMLRFGEIGNINTSPWLWIIHYLLKYESLVGLVFLGGLVYCLCRSQRRHWVFISLILVVFLSAGKSSKASLHYLLPAYPALAILGAVFIDRVFSYFSKKGKVIGGILFLFILVLMSLKIFALEQRFLSKDSRIIAKDWIERNIPAGAKIALFALRLRDLPPLVSHGGEVASVDYGPKARSVYGNRRLEELMDKYYSSVKTYRIYRMEKEIPDEEIEHGLANLGYSGNIFLKANYKQGWKSLAEMKSQKIEYIILSSFLYELYQGSPPDSRHPLYLLAKRDKAFFAALMNSGELRLIKEVPAGKSLGPTIRIYKIIY